MDEDKEKRCNVSTSNTFWLHYLSLEKSLLEISEYIAITEDNYHCYSFKNMQLYFTICSEVDSIFKYIKRNLGVNNPKKKNITIVDNTSMLDSFFPAVRDTVIVTNISGSALEFQPLKILFTDHIDEVIDVNESTSWWRQYNDVKHQRLNNFDKASLKNILESLSALHILNLIHALSLEPDLIGDYEEVLIQASTINHYPVLQLKNSGIRSYAGGGSFFYAGFLNNQILPENKLQKELNSI